MKSSVVKALAVVSFVTLNAFTLQSQARIMGFLSESPTREALKIESANIPNDVQIKVTFYGHKTPLKPSANSPFAGFNGPIALSDMAGPEFKNDAVISLSQEPQFPEFINLLQIPEPEREAKNKEWKEKAASLTGQQTQVLNLKQDILAKLIQADYVNLIYDDILNGKLSLVIAIQSISAGDSDYDLKFIRLDSKTIGTGGVLYQSGASK